MNETPILNAICRPWKVQGYDLYSTDIEGHAEALLTQRATVVDAGALSGAFNPFDTIDRIPGCIMQLPLMWVEQSASDYCPNVVGVLSRGISSKDLPEQRDSGPISCLEGFHKVVSGLEAEVPDGLKLITESVVYLYCSGSRAVIGPLSRMWYAADPRSGFQIAKDPNSEGAFLSRYLAEHTPYLSYLKRKESDAYGIISALHVNATRLVASVQAFMFASNIELSEGPCTNSHVGAKRRAVDRLPCLRRKVLKLRRGTELVDMLPASMSTGSMPMHLVRGHFKVYGKDGRKKMFGKYTRSVWCPPHVRGNPEAGVIEKDYELVDG